MQDDLKAWEPADENEVTPALVHHIAMDVLEGTPDPAQVRRILQHFVDSPGAPTLAMLDYLRQSLRHYLALPDPKRGDLERSFGLVARRGAPQRNLRRDHQIAWDVLRLRLAGSTLETASQTTAETYKIPDNKVRDIWAKHKATVFDFEAVHRALGSQDRRARWSAEEAAALAVIYPNLIRAP